MVRSSLGLACVFLVTRNVRVSNTGRSREVVNWSLHSEFVNLSFCHFTDSSGNWPLFCRLRGSSSTIYQWPVPLPTHGVLLTPQIQCQEHPRQGFTTTHYAKYWRHPYIFEITHSPITLSILSSVKLVSIFRCSSPPHNPVYASREDPSVLAFILSSHLFGYACDQVWQMGVNLSAGE